MKQGGGFLLTRSASILSDKDKFKRHDAINSNKKVRKIIMAMRGSAPHLILINFCFQVDLPLMFPLTSTQVQ
ncbi:hypothetical protein AU501_13540 [Lonsdalea populi]|nr:hypothetical protein AU501_13540 [Lonsdalea populi]